MIIVHGARRVCKNIIVLFFDRKGSWEKYHTTDYKKIASFLQNRISELSFYYKGRMGVVIQAIQAFEVTSPMFTIESLIYKITLCLVNNFK